MVGNIPAARGGGGNCPNIANPQIPWLRTTVVAVPSVQHPLPKH